MGADPWAVRRVTGGWVGVLRGRSAVVLLDEDLRELARVPAPRSPSGIAIAKNGDVVVVGELSPVIARYVVRGKTLVATTETRVPGVFGLRDVAIAPDGGIWALDGRGTNLVRPSGETVAVGHGASQLVTTSKHVIVNAVADHEIVVFEHARAGGASALLGAPVRIKNDGPMWGFDARETPAGLVVVAGGVEDHPLDRTGGFFGYIDSFVYVDRVADGAVQRVAAINASEHGVVTPKAIAIESADGARAEILITAYGSAAAMRVGLALVASAGKPPMFEPIALVPGSRGLERASAGPKAKVVIANPLLDAWVMLDESGRVRVVPVTATPGETEPARAVASRLGEALFFTSLMAPKNTSEGALSRFTCETCHFEGYVDGRTHHTGRDDVHATTKPLVGLVGNRPYFSRAMDPDMSTVAHAEFRVAGEGSKVDPFFAVEPREHGWLGHVGVKERTEPLELRRALMRFLTDFSHRPNPAVVSRVTRGAASFDDKEREGARLFAERCEGCHAARLSADDAGTRVPNERWEAMVLSDSAPIVWGSAGYRKTGVLPYVHTEGARTPSLRRLYKKYPYFTNGSAKSLEDVLVGVRFKGGETWHALATAPADAEALDVKGRDAVRAFLELL